MATMTQNEALKAVEIPLKELKEYANNPRKITQAAIDYVAKAIETYGFLQPIVVDGEGVIICGHVRYNAAKKLKLKKVPCVKATDLTPEQVRAFRLADNKVASIATWDNEKLREEFGKIADAFTAEDLGFDTSLLFPSSEFSGGEDAGEADMKNSCSELDVGDFDDDKFEHVCPHCGLRFT